MCLRYQDIKTNGHYRCLEETCKLSWQSKHTWIRFDLCRQTIRLFGQTCPSIRKDSNNEKGFKNPLSNLHLQRYTFPVDFTEIRVSKLCRKAIKSKLISKCNLFQDIFHKYVIDKYDVKLNICRGYISITNKIIIIVSIPAA